MIPILFGFGKQLAEIHIEHIYDRPSSITIAKITNPKAVVPPEVFRLTEAVSQIETQSSANTLMVAVESAPFTTPTPAFVIEVTHPDKPILNMFAFTQTMSEGVRPFTVVPIVHDGGRFRVMLPPQSLGQKICFVLEFESKQGDDPQMIGKRIILRALE